MAQMIFFVRAALMVSSAITRGACSVIAFLFYVDPDPEMKDCPAPTGQLRLGMHRGTQRRKRFCEKRRDSEIFTKALFYS
jgi:hypothetical protein